MDGYRGRIAPTPTGYLHAGHAATFATARDRATAARGSLLLRIEDLDPQRCKPEYTAAAIEDLEWLGIRCTDGPYFQSLRSEFYLTAWRALRDRGFIYPCQRSRRDVELASQAPHEEEPVFPADWRVPVSEAARWENPAGVNWRFRVPDGETVAFSDGNYGDIAKVAGVDFGDFLVWNRCDVPAYELAVVADDADMRVTEVVRGEDLLISTCRQLLIYRALGFSSPAFFHCPLLRDGEGRRLAKRDAALTLRTLRERGVSPEEVLAMGSVLRPGD